MPWNEATNSREEAKGLLSFEIVVATPKRSTNTIFVSELKRIFFFFVL